MRKSEPPLGRGSARKWGLIFSSFGPKATMKSVAGSSSSSSYRSRFAANHSRSLFAFSSSRNANSSGRNDACAVVVAMAPSFRVGDSRGRKLLDVLVLRVAARAVDESERRAVGREVREHARPHRDHE